MSYNWKNATSVDFGSLGKSPGVPMPFLDGIPPEFVLLSLRASPSIDAVPRFAFCDLASGFTDALFVLGVTPDKFTPSPWIADHSSTASQEVRGEG